MNSHLQYEKLGKVHWNTSANKATPSTPFPSQQPNRPYRRTTSSLPQKHPPTSQNTTVSDTVPDQTSPTTQDATFTRTPAERASVQKLRDVFSLERLVLAQMRSRTTSSRLKKSDGSSSVILTAYSAYRIHWAARHKPRRKHLMKSTS